jgi:hypothetical protein
MIGFMEKLVIGSKAQADACYWAKRMLAIGHKRTLAIGHKRTRYWAQADACARKVFFSLFNN